MTPPFFMHVLIVEPSLQALELVRELSVVEPRVVGPQATVLPTLLSALIVRVETRPGSSSRGGPETA